MSTPHLRSPANFFSPFSIPPILIIYYYLLHLYNTT
nr:MAG TPA: hypothetical protein [Caudoviricetes sp.]